jgi:hypothetical protein
MTTSFNGVSALIINGHGEMYCEPNERHYCIYPTMVQEMRTFLNSGFARDDVEHIINIIKTNTTIIAGVAGININIPLLTHTPSRKQFQTNHVNQTLNNSKFVNILIKEILLLGYDENDRIKYARWFVTVYLFYDLIFSELSAGSNCSKFTNLILQNPDKNTHAFYYKLVCAFKRATDIQGIKEFVEQHIIPQLVVNQLLSGLSYLMGIMGKMIVLCNTLVICNNQLLQTSCNLYESSEIMTEYKIDDKTYEKYVMIDPDVQQLDAGLHIGHSDDGVDIIVLNNATELEYRSGNSYRNTRRAVNYQNYVGLIKREYMASYGIVNALIDTIRNTKYVPMSIVLLLNFFTSPNRLHQKYIFDITCNHDHSVGLGFVHPTTMNRQMPSVVGIGVRKRRRSVRKRSVRRRRSVRK